MSLLPRRRRPDNAPLPPAHIQPYGENPAAKAERRGVDQDPSPVVDDDIARAARRLLDIPED